MQRDFREKKFKKGLVTSINPVYICAAPVEGTLWCRVAGLKRRNANSGNWEVPCVENFESVCDYLNKIQPSNPVLCYRPHAAARSAQWFLENFPGDVLYAVKANPSPLILDVLYEAGIRHFDIASLGELRLVNHYPDVQLYCMNTVKHPEHIRQMYFEYGVRDFSLDCQDELDKILVATGHAKDLHLHVRISVDNSSSCMPLDKKFGAHPDEAVALLVNTRLSAAELGVCFHVGSQAMDPTAYADAITRANRLIRKAGVMIESLDVGGGFPAAYPGLRTPPLDTYIQTIVGAFEDSLTTETCRLKCEPGRSLVADAASMLLYVSLRKGEWLYLNDGAYGSLFDAAHSGFLYPLRAVRDGRWIQADYDTGFRLYGPTCDSIDAVTRPQFLPATMRAGDYIEFGQLGAYGDALRTDFNGFGVRDEIVLNDEPMMSVFLSEQSGEEITFGRDIE